MEISSGENNKYLNNRTQSISKVRVNKRYKSKKILIKTSRDRKKMQSLHNRSKKKIVKV